MLFEYFKCVVSFKQSAIHTETRRGKPRLADTGIIETFVSKGLVGQFGRDICKYRFDIAFILING
jgi:hypothetical protein